MERGLLKSGDAVITNWRILSVWIAAVAALAFAPVAWGQSADAEKIRAGLLASVTANKAEVERGAKVAWELRRHPMATDGRKNEYTSREFCSGVYSGVRYAYKVYPTEDALKNGQFDVDARCDGSTTLTIKPNRIDEGGRGLAVIGDAAEMCSPWDGRNHMLLLGYEYSFAPDEVLSSETAVLSPQPEKINGYDAYLVTDATPYGYVLKYWFAPDVSGNPVRLEFWAKGATLTKSVDYSDFQRQSNGVWLPMRVERQYDATIADVLIVRELQVGQTVDEGLFEVDLDSIPKGYLVRDNRHGIGRPGGSPTNVTFARGQSAEADKIRAALLESVIANKAEVERGAKAVWNVHVYSEMPDGSRTERVSGEIRSGVYSGSRYAYKTYPSRDAFKDEQFDRHTRCDGTVTLTIEPNATNQGVRGKATISNTENNDPWFHVMPTLLLGCKFAFGPEDVLRSDAAVLSVRPEKVDGYDTYPVTYTAPYGNVFKYWFAPEVSGNAVRVAMWSRSGTLAMLTNMSDFKRQDSGLWLPMKAERRNFGMGDLGTYVDVVTVDDIQLGEIPGESPFEADPESIPKGYYVVDMMRSGRSYVKGEAPAWFRSILGKMNVVKRLSPNASVGAGEDSEFMKMWTALLEAVKANKAEVERGARLTWALRTYTIASDDSKSGETTALYSGVYSGARYAYKAYPSADALKHEQFDEYTRCDGATVLTIKPNETKDRVGGVAVLADAEKDEEWVQSMHLVLLGYDFPFAPDEGINDDGGDIDTLTKEVVNGHETFLVMYTTRACDTLRYWVSHEVSDNPVRLESWTRSRFRSTRTDLSDFKRQDSGLWLPMHVERKNYGMKDGGTFVRVLTVLDIQVGQAVDDSLFEVDLDSIPKGYVVQDMRSGL